MFQEVFSLSKRKLLLKRVIPLGSFIPVRPISGTKGIKYLRQNLPIEVKNDIALCYVEELEKYADFSFYHHTDKYNKGWTTICKVNK